MDEWAPADLALLSDSAYGWIARLLNVIENGGAWPRGMCLARAAFMVKDPKKVEQPLSYRILLILSAIYRRWATLRLRHMSEWISTWALPEMYAGVHGRGAADAWYATAAEMEEAFVVDGSPVTGGAVDIHKCFDQILRPIVYKLAGLAGMPVAVLDTYKRYQEGLEVRNSIAGGLGRSYRKEASIPQGDPFSMMLVALIM